MAFQRFVRLLWASLGSFRRACEVLGDALGVLKNVIIESHLIKFDGLDLDIFRSLSFVKIFENQCVCTWSLVARRVGGNCDVILNFQETILSYSVVCWLSIQEIDPSDRTWTLHICDIESVLPFEFRHHQIISV